MDDSRADEAYEWGVRVLYTALIFGNLLLIWDAWKDTAAGIEFRAKLTARARRVRDCEGCSRRRDALRRATGRVLWDAQQTVEVGPDWDKESERPA